MARCLKPLSNKDAELVAACANAYRELAINHPGLRMECFLRALPNEQSRTEFVKLIHFGNASDAADLEYPAQESELTEEEAGYLMKVMDQNGKKAN